MHTPGGPLGLGPGAPLRGAPAIPGSKSIAQRALVCASLAHGRTRLAGLPDGGDVRASLALASSVARASSSLGERAVELDGRPPAERGAAFPRAVAVGESGTLARLATAALGLGAGSGRSIRIEASGTLLRRASPPLFASLRAAGVELDGSTWPVELVPVPAPERVRLERPVSSQEVSALLLALAAWPGERRLEVEGEIPSRPYVDLTLAVLQEFAATIREEPGPARSVFVVRGPLRAPAGILVVEPDASLAAVALAAGCLSGGEVQVTGLGQGSIQGDVRIVEHLRAFGCSASASATQLQAGGLPVRGAQLDLTGEPDLAPVLAVVAAAASLQAAGDGGRSELRGLGTLPRKESSRIRVLAAGLEACGFEIEAGGDRLAIAPPRRPLTGPCLLDPHGDHRMAFAFALLGLVREGVLVLDPGCVAKSWPGFWEALPALGARLRRG